jgi:hypothetical protein
MIHPALASSRSRWVALPFLAVIVLAGLWTAFWFYAASTAEAMLARWREQETKFGRIYTCGSQTTGGYPFRIEVRCGEATVEMRSLKPQIVVKAKDLLVVAQVYDPTLLIGEIAGPLIVAEAGGGDSLTATWKLAQVSIRGRPNAPERVSVVADDLRIDRGRESGGTKLATANHLELHARVSPSATPENPVVDLVVRLAGATAPGAGNLAMQPLDADITAALRGLKSYVPKPLPVMLRELQAAGGRLDVSNARVQQGERLARATGSLGLSPSGRLDGTVQVTLGGGFEQLVMAWKNPSVSASPPNTAARALSAFDRFAPALGGAGRDQVAAGLLGLLGERTQLDGKPAVTMQLRLTDGAAVLGPISLGQMPPLY